MELQKEIDPLRLEHSRKMQHQDREREESQCDAEQAVTKHFEESLRRANHPSWSQSQPLHPKPMPIFQPSPASLPNVVSHHSASSSVGGSIHQSSSYSSSNDHQGHSAPSDSHQTRNSFGGNPVADRDPMLHERKPPANHVQPVLHHSHNKPFDNQRHHEQPHQQHHQQQQPIYMKPMPQDNKHDPSTQDDTRKMMSRGSSAKEQLIIQPQQQYLKTMKSAPPTKSQPGIRRETSFRPSPINDRDLMIMQQQEYLIRNSDAILVQQPPPLQMHHSRRINEIPIEMQQSSTVGVIVKRDMHPQHQQMQQQAPPHSGPAYGNKHRNSAYSNAQVAIHKPTPQSHSPSGGSRVMYEYRQVPLTMSGGGGSSIGDPKSPAHHLYQSISPHQPQHLTKPIPITGSLNPSSSPALLVHPSSRHPNIASPPINKSKVSAPAPTHIYGKPIELNSPGIVSGIPVCQSRRESPSKITYTPSAIGINVSPTSSSIMNPAPPPAHLSRPNDVRQYTSRLPMHASSPPPTGPQSPSPSLLVQKATTISPLTSPMLHSQSLPIHHSALITTSSVRSDTSSPSSFQTQPLDLGVSNRVDHHYNPKRKASQVLSASTEALDIRKKRTDPSPPAHHLHADSSTMFTAGRMSPGVAVYRTSNTPTDIRRSIPGGPPPPAPSSIIGHYDVIPVTPQTVYVPSSLTVGSNRHNFPKTIEANASQPLIDTNSASESTNTNNTQHTKYNHSNNNISNNNKSNNNIENIAQLPVAPNVGPPTGYTPTPSTTISKEQQPRTLTPEIPVAPEHDKPVVNQSAPPRHLKKAWLQRHTGEDSESNNDKCPTAATKLSSLSSPLAIAATTPSPAPSATPTPPPTTPTGTQLQMTSNTVAQSQAPVVHSSSSTTSSLSSPSTTSSTPPPPPHTSRSPNAAAAVSSAPLSTQHNNNTANHAAASPTSVATRNC